MTLIPIIKQLLTDETAGDADDEKDIRDESVDINRQHRYYHQLSATSLFRFNQQSLTSEDDDDDDDLLLSDDHGMMDFMDRVNLNFSEVLISLFF
jgi:hypothetical protein